jgi:hemolysin D
MKQSPNPAAKDNPPEGFRKHWRSLDRWIDARFGSDEANFDEALVNRFKSDADAIEEARVPLSAHAALYGVLALLAIAILWSILGRIDRIVVAPGKLVTRTPAIVLQPFTTSRILSVPVRAGDHVKKGQLLVSFDPAFAAADETSNAQKAHAGGVEIERLEAELSGEKKFGAGSNDPDRRTQSQIFAQDKAELSAQMSVRDQRINEIDAQIKADNAIIVGLTRQVETARKIVEIRQRLLDQGAGAPLDVMNAQTSEIDLESRLKSTAGDAAKLTQQRAETEFERQTVLQKWRSDKNQQLVQTRQQVADATQTLSKARKMSDLTELRAPIDGVILEIAQRSTGSVLREAETLVTMVPDNSNLYVEANIPARDIGYVKVGQIVRIKLEAYPFQRYGTVDGTLEVVSADALPLKDDKNSQMVYRAQVRLSSAPTELAGRAINLRPGLVASAEIKAGKRSIAAYILSPVLRTVDEGMREP